MTDDNDSAPVPLTGDAEWRDWMPGHQPLFRNETPAEHDRRRAARRTRWRRLLGLA